MGPIEPSPDRDSRFSHSNRNSDLVRRAKNHAIYVVARIALAIFKRVSRKSLLFFGRALGRVAWCFVPSARRRALANIAIAFPALSRQQQRALTRRSFVELGELLGDTVALFDRKSPVALPFVGNSRQLIEEAFEARRGVVLVTAHFGPWERLAAALVEAGFSLSTPVRRSYDPRLEALVHAPLRASRGVVALDRDAATTPIRLVRALRGNGVAGFLIDINTRVASVRVPFFGVQAWTPIAPARLALRTGSPVVVAMAVREGILVQRLREARPPQRGIIDREAIELTAEMTACICAIIAKEPERWIWMHDRWGARRPLSSEHGPAA